MKILETMYQKVPHWLVFNGMEIVAKFTTKEEAEEYINQNK